jgi:hypothetical protein
MRDSNPRGRESNPLSNPEDACTSGFAGALLLVSQSDKCVYEHTRTTAVETPIETPDCQRANQAPGGTQSARDHVFANIRLASCDPPSARDSVSRER